MCYSDREAGFKGGGMAYGTTDEFKNGGVIRDILA